MNNPPLSQSRQALLACDLLYTEAVVKGRVAPPNEYSQRGRQIHAVISAYINHLVKVKRTSDIDTINLLAANYPGEAGEILRDLGKKLVIDPEKVWGTEVKIQLNEHFVVPEDAQDPKFKAAYEMTLDLVQLHDAHTAELTDWKSYYGVVDPDTFQARLYSLGLMMLNPQIEKVIFRLEFVRWGVARTAIFTREDIPRLQTEATGYRMRQVHLHQNGNKVEATAGLHCRYCPLLADRCPHRDVLDLAAKQPGDLVGLAMYHKYAFEQVSVLLRDHCKENGAVNYDDKAGHTYRAEWGIQARRSFPLIETSRIIADWQAKTRDMLADKLTVSGLSSPLKAKKRADLLDALANVADVKTIGKFKMGLVRDDGSMTDEEDAA